MLHAPCLRLCTPCPGTSTSRSWACQSLDANSSLQRGTSSERHRLPRRVRAQAFFDRVFAREKRHAPELVKLDAEDEGGLGQTSTELFGPLAVLMIGFQEQEIQAFRSVMLEMDADMVKCVGQRAMILSGMNAAEVGEIIGGYRDAGLPEPVWAAALAANWDRKVKDLVDDIYGDHNYMMERERNAEATS